MPECNWYPLRRCGSLQFRSKLLSSDNNVLNGSDSKCLIDLTLVCNTCTIYIFIFTKVGMSGGYLNLPGCGENYRTPRYCFNRQDNRTSEGTQRNLSEQLSYFVSLFVALLPNLLHKFPGGSHDQTAGLGRGPIIPP